MGEIANIHVNNFASGRWGERLPEPRTYPKTTREAIAANRFKVVVVTGGRTNRLPGTKLVVCDGPVGTYWVWASKQVTGISKEVCSVLADDMSLNEALAMLKRKPYTGPVAPQGLDQIQDT